jgi:hypothetical protein
MVLSYILRLVHKARSGGPFLYIYRAQTSKNVPKCPNDSDNSDRGQILSESGLLKGHLIDAVLTGTCPLSSLANPLVTKQKYSQNRDLFIFLVYFKLIVYLCAVNN